MSDEPYTGQFAFIRNRKVPLMNADGGTACVCVDRVDLSNAELRSTNPVTLVKAPGPGKQIWLQHIAAVLRFPTGNAFTTSTTASFTIGGTQQATTTQLSAALLFTVSRYIAQQTISVTAQTLSTGVDQPLLWSLSNALTGNANNDNTVSLYLTYVIIDTV